MTNEVYKKVIEEFGDEWNKFDQVQLSAEEHDEQFRRYVNTPHFEEMLGKKSINIADVGAGSGRWTSKLREYFGLSSITAIEPTHAEEVLKARFQSDLNTSVVRCAFDALPNPNVPPQGFDLVCCWGVLHHTNSIETNFAKLVQITKPGGVIFCYIYYDLDFRPVWYKAIWRASNLLRYMISISPRFLKGILCELIAAFIYLPIVVVGRLFPKTSQPKLPLYGYYNRSFYSIRTDARDRFGTRVEKRMPKKSIIKMCEENGLEDIKFSDTHPYWVFSCKKSNGH